LFHQVVLAAVHHRDVGAIPFNGAATWKTRAWVVSINLSMPIIFGTDSLMGFTAASPGPLARPGKLGSSLKSAGEAQRRSQQQ
jgi:hypothetical protein